MSYIIPLTVAVSRANAALRGSTQHTKQSLDEAIISLTASTAENAATPDANHTLAFELSQLRREWYGTKG